MQATFFIHVGFNVKIFDCFKVSVKRKETALKYLKHWKRQIIEENKQPLYKSFFIPGSEYQIISTPDGFDYGEVVLSGKMDEL